MDERAFWRPEKRQDSMVEPITDRDLQLAFGDRAEEAATLLRSYGTEESHREPDRVRRAIVKLSDGDLERLRHYLEVAQQDYRDVLYWAEYPRDPSAPNTYEELRTRLKLPPVAE